MHDSRPIYGPWQIYFRAEEEAQIRESLQRKSDRYRTWDNRKRGNGNGTLYFVLSTPIEAVS